MKKIIILTLMFIFCTCMFVGATTICYAEEIEEEVIENTQVENNQILEEQPSDSIVETYLDKLANIDEYTANVTKWIISAVLGLLGTSAVAVAFRKQLKDLINKVLTALGLLKENKELAEQDIKEIKESAQDTIASLQNVKGELFEVNKEEFIQVKKDLADIKESLRIIAAGTKELVVNGSAESVCNKLKSLNKEVVEDESKQIQ